MIEFAGAGVAMGNACDALKEAADYITLSNDDDGLAYAIYNILKIWYRGQKVQTHMSLLVILYESGDVIRNKW